VFLHPDATLSFSASAEVSSRLAAAQWRTTVNISIYHKASPDFRAYTTPFDANNFTCVGVLHTSLSGDDALEYAYCKTQNIDGPWNPSSPCRSTSVGDVLELDGKHYVVAPIGFTMLPDPSDHATSRGVVIYHEKDGVYLGSALGLAFFSALDPVGQSEATAFRSRDEAAEHVASWRTGDTANTTAYRFIEVDVTDRGSATIDACVKAGLPAWNPEG